MEVALTTYRRVTLEDRFKIKTCLELGLYQNEIAVKLGFNKSTISRELSRNTGGRGYRLKQAERLSTERQAWRSNSRKMTKPIKESIDKLTRIKWSPSQISKRLSQENKLTVSHETIYQYIYKDFKSGGNLYTNLRFSHRKRKPRFPRKSKDRRGIIKNAISIEERSEEANSRKCIGHWERDTMFGKDRRNSVLMLVDRKSRYIKLGKLSRRTSILTLKKTKELLVDLPLKTITNDRGKEFTDHEQLTKDLKVTVYFCHPYTSSERGTVENRIGILRQYLPKGSDLKNLKQKELSIIETELNNRPMKCLDWKTPYEVLYKKKVALTT